METLIQIPAIWVVPISALIPWFTAAAVKKENSDARRAMVAALAVVAIAVLEAITASGGFTLEGLISTTMVVFIGQLGAFQGFWKPLMNVNEKTPDTVSVL